MGNQQTSPEMFSHSFPPTPPDLQHKQQPASSQQRRRLVHTCREFHCHCPLCTGWSQKGTVTPIMLWDKDVSGGHSNCYSLHDFVSEICLPRALKVLTKIWELVVIEWNPEVQMRYVQLGKQVHLRFYIIF